MFSAATNITEIFKSRLKAINNVNKFIVDGKIDQAVLKNIQKTLPEIEKTFDQLKNAAKKFQQIKLPNVITSQIFEISLNAFLENNELITTKMNNIVVSKDIEQNVKSLNKILDAIVVTSANLVLIGKNSVKLLALKKPIIKGIETIKDICKLMSNDFAIVNLAGLDVINKAITELGQTIKNFAVVGFLVPAAIIGMYLVKFFLKLFFKSFNLITIKEIAVSEKAIVQMILTITLLCGAITLMALAGVIAIIAWKEILVTLAFVTLILSVFIILSNMLPVIKMAMRTPKMIAQTMLLLSMVIVLWALTGQLILEQWTVILRVMLFIGLGIGLFALLSLATKLIKEGGSQVAKIALALLLLTTVVIIWALAGGLIIENWLNVLVIAIFVGVAIGLFALLSAAAKSMQKGAISVLLMSVAFAILSGVALLMIFVGQQIEKNWVQLLLIGAFIVATIAIFAGLSFAFTPIVLGAAALGIMGAALLIFSLSILALVGAVSKWQDEYTETFGKMIWELGLKVSKLGLLTIPIGLGSAALAVMGAAMLLFAAPLAIFAAIIPKWNDNYTETFGNMLNGIGKQFSKLGLLSIPIGLGAAALGIMGVALLPFAASIAIIVNTLEQLLKLNIDETNAGDILKTPIAIMYSAMDYASEIKMAKVLSGSFKINALGSSAESLSNIADTIQKYAELKVPDKFDKNGKPISFHPMKPEEFEAAANNIRTIITFLLDTISDEKTTAILEEMSEDAIENIGLIMQNTAGVTNLIDAIEKAAKFDETTIKTSIGNLGNIIQEYIIKLQTLFIGTGEIEEKVGFWGGKSYEFKITGAPTIDVEQIEDIVDAMEEINETIEPVKLLMESIENIVKPEESNVQKIGTAISAYINAIMGDEKRKGIPTDSMFANKMKNLNYLITQNERLSKIDTTTIQKNTDNFSKFIDKANSIDSDKIKSVRDMFEQMAEFSKSIHGDFDKLADILSEKLVDVLDKLRGVIEDKPENNSFDFVQNTEKTANKNEKNENINSLTNNQKDEKNTEKTDKNNNIKDILDSLEEITMVLKGVKENTENINGNY